MARRDFSEQTVPAQLKVAHELLDEVGRELARNDPAAAVMAASGAAIYTARLVESLLLSAVRVTRRRT